MPLANTGSALHRAVQQGANRAAKREIFTLKDGQVGVLRFLHFDEDFKIIVHERWNNAKKTRDVEAICGDVFRRECPYCAKGDDELEREKIRKVEYWLFSAWWIKLIEKPPAPEERGTEIPVNTQCMVAWKLAEKSATPLIDVYEAMTERLEEGLAITDYSFKFTRRGNGTDTTYVTYAMNASPLTLPAGLVVWDNDALLKKYQEKIERSAAWNKREAEKATPKPSSNGSGASDQEEEVKID